MKKSLWALTIALLVSAPIASAYAVDVFNEDDQDYLLFFDVEDEGFQTPILAGQSIANLCKACDLYISDDEEPLKAKGMEVVVIRNGKILLEK